MHKFKAPYYPIIYVRGYAMTQSEINETTADPFCGFNLGSTVYRAVADKNQKTRKYVFESPVVRLASDFEYSDVYEDGYDIQDDEWSTDAEGKSTGNRLDSRSIVIYRYYDAASNLLGGGKVPPIEEFAKGLSKLVEKVRDLVCANPNNEVTPETFKCYLVAHSMGGLVCRAFLQNPACDPRGTAGHVDKFFTYATPHNGIDVAGKNIPSWAGMFDINNFDRDKRMPEYLNLKAEATLHSRVDLLPESRFPSRKVFCMVGTNRNDYEAAAGLSRTFVGHGSDGLVRIENATLVGLNQDGTIGAPCAKAFAFRAHSGYFGIVNSEEAFQNLWRFLFGDVRVDVWLELEEIRLPPKVQLLVDKKKTLDALYQIEFLASPRGKLWYLSRRVAEEDSVACVRHQTWQQNKSQYLTTVFLANRARINPRRRSLAYSVSLGIRVPDYEIENRLWINEHFEGGYLFRNSLVLEMFPPENDETDWRVKHAWQGTGVAPASQPISPTKLGDGNLEVTVPFDSVIADENKTKPAYPGIRGKLRFVISAWNNETAIDI